MKNDRISHPWFIRTNQHIYFVVSLKQILLIGREWTFRTYDSFVVLV